MMAPWPTIGQAVSAAAPDGLIAVAAGTYAEKVVIHNKPVRLWGVCPEQVTIEATGSSANYCPLAAVCILTDADGTEIGGIALRSAGTGITMSGSRDVLIDRVRVHDNANFGIDASSELGPTSLVVRDTLIERNNFIGLFLAGAEATVSASVVRTTLPRLSDQMFGRGISMQLFCLDTPTGLECDPWAWAKASITRSLIEQNHDYGLLAAGSEVTLDSTVVRGTLPRASDQTRGRGVSVELSCVNTPTGLQCDPSLRATATLTRSLIEQNHEVGLFVGSSDAVVDTTVVRATHPRPADGLSGAGIRIQVGCVETPEGVQCDPAMQATASVTRSLIEQNHEIGLAVIGSIVTLDATVVRDTWPAAADGLYGDGVSIVRRAAASSTAITNTLIADSSRAGLATFGAFVSLANSHLRCAAFELTGESHDSGDFEVVDSGGNLCGCPSSLDSCHLVSAGLDPPPPLVPTD